MRRIAILTSTRPIRQRLQEIGRTVETLDPRKCQMLAQQYDVIILGSRASDVFYQRIKSTLPRGIRDKFRFYSRSYFESFKRRGNLPSEFDDRTEGWKQILEANEISFVKRARVLQNDLTEEEQNFHWRNLSDFIRDKRVTVLSR